MQEAAPAALPSPGGIRELPKKPARGAAAALQGLWWFFPWILPSSLQTPAQGAGRWLLPPPERVPAPQGLHTHGCCGRASLHFAEGFLKPSFMSWVIFPVSGTSCKSIHVSTEFVTLFGESGTFDNDPWPAFKLSFGCCQRTRLGGKHAVLISCRTARRWRSCWEACPRHGRETMSPSSSSSSQAWHKVSNTSRS